MGPDQHQAICQTNAEYSWIEHNNQISIKYFAGFSRLQPIEQFQPVKFLIKFETFSLHVKKVNGNIQESHSIHLLNQC